MGFTHLTCALKCSYISSHLIGTKILQGNWGEWKRDRKEEWKTLFFFSFFYFIIFYFI